MDLRAMLEATDDEETSVTSNERSPKFKLKTIVIISLIVIAHIFG
jgi:hypothetical protein